MRAKVLEEIIKLDVSDDEREKLKLALLVNLKSPEEIKKETLTKFSDPFARDFPKTSIVLSTYSRQ
jgi:hypothetical protein